MPAVSTRVNDNTNQKIERYKRENGFDSKSQAASDLLRQATNRIDQQRQRREQRITTLKRLAFALFVTAAFLLGLAIIAATSVNVYNSLV